MVKVQVTDGHVPALGIKMSWHMGSVELLRYLNKRSFAISVMAASERGIISEFISQLLVEFIVESNQMVCVYAQVVFDQQVFSGIGLGK